MDFGGIRGKPEFMAMPNMSSDGLRLSGARPRPRYSPATGARASAYRPENGGAWSHLPRRA